MASRVFFNGEILLSNSFVSISVSNSNVLCNCLFCHYLCLFLWKSRKQLYLDFKPSFSFLKRLFFIQQISSIVPNQGKWLSMFVHAQTSQVQSILRVSYCLACQCFQLVYILN